MHYSAIKRKIVKRIDKLCCQPIEIFVFHAVSDSFDPALNKQVDWSSTTEFKQRILSFKQQYTFISLDDAYHCLHRDFSRHKKLAVLTCDDGFASILSILPFLEHEQVPITLFINPKYLDGTSIRTGYATAPKYITQNQLFALKSNLTSIGMHGYEHLDATKQTPEEFAESVDKCINILSSHPRYIPFFAYTWGNHNDTTDRILAEKNIVPVLCDGGATRRYYNGISRKPIDTQYLQSELVNSLIR